MPFKCNFYLLIFIGKMSEHDGIKTWLIYLEIIFIGKMSKHDGIKTWLIYLEKTISQVPVPGINNYTSLQEINSSPTNTPQKSLQRLLVIGSYMLIRYTITC